MRGFHREPRRVVAIKSTNGQFSPIRPTRAGCFLGLIALFIVGSSVCCADSVFIETVSARPGVRLSVPHYTLDGDRETFWAAQNFQGHASHLPSGYKNLDRQWITYGLNREAEIDKIGILWGSDYSVTAPYGTGHRAIRTSQREAGCSNLFVDQPMIRAALLWDRLHKRDHFTPNVNQYIQWYFGNHVSAKTGFLDWGVHTSYDVFDESIRHADGLQHEVQAILPVWTAFHAADAKATGDYLEKFWSLHTDAKTGIVDRHPTRGRGLDFCMAARPWKESDI